MRRLTAVPWRSGVPVIALALVLGVAGCSAPVPPADLVGEFRGPDGAPTLILGDDGSMEIDDLPPDLAGTHSGQPSVDVHGAWEVLRGVSGTVDFVYVTIAEPIPGMTAGFQVYIEDEDTLYLKSDPDHGPRLPLSRTDASEPARTPGR